MKTKVYISANPECGLVSCFKKQSDMEEQSVRLRKNRPVSRQTNDSAWTVVTEYSRNSTIHGLSYLSETRRHWSERACWLLTWIGLFIACLCAIFVSYQEWQSSPVVLINVDETPAHVWQVPFPAVTICPDHRFHDLNMTNINEIFECLTTQGCVLPDNKYRESQAFLMLCFARKHKLRSQDQRILNSTMYKAIAELSPDIDEVFQRCKLGEKVVNCSQVIQKSLTSQGICFTFNMLSPEDMFYESNALGQNDIYSTDSPPDTPGIMNWNIHSGYTDSLPTSTYPRRTFGSGAMPDNRFEFLLRAGIPAKYCDAPSYTYRYLIHAPFESPEFTSKGHLILTRLSSMTILNMIPKMVNTDDTLRELPPQRRQCYFSDERPLTFHRVYSQKNCERECLTDYILKTFDCVPFYMLRNRSTPICSTDENHHISAVEISFNEGILALQEKTKCQCMPSCQSLDYSVEPMEHISTLLGNSLLLLTFDDKPIEAMRRDQIFSAIDFGSNCCGLLGLFLGISLLSLAELFYWMTIRVACAMRTESVEVVEEERDIVKIREEEQSIITNKELSTAIIV